MAQHHHAVGVPAILVNLNAGQDDNSIGFQQYYNINVVGWDINCAACCWTYLTQVRNYATEHGVNHVRFGQVHNLVSCFVAPPIGPNPPNRHGQFKTEQNLQFGTPVLKLLVSDFSTFRFYANPPIPPPKQIGIGTPVTARIESISIHKVSDEKINGSWLYYNHAALCELFRATAANPALPPLHGVCVAGQQGQVAMFKSEVPSDGIKGTKESPFKREKGDDVDKLTEGMKRLASH